MKKMYKMGKQMLSKNFLLKVSVNQERYDQGI